jgi:DNA-binding transcriptional LysR family regulator
MHINQLNYFISVAKHLNFTKAAKEHYIAQTAISQQIIALEKELNVLLFYRNKRTVQLTHAGGIFYSEVQRIVASLGDAIHNAQMNAQIDNANYHGTLTMGFEQPHEKGLLAYLIRNFRSAYPNIKLTLIHDCIDNLQEAVQEGTLDFVFRLSFDKDEVSKFSWRTVSNAFKDPLCTIVHTNHPLAKQTSIDRSALANERFVHFDRKSAPMGFHAMLRDCKKSGFSPNIVAESTSPETLLLLVEAEIGIAILPLSFGTYANSDTIRFIELKGESEYTELIVAWRPNNFNPAISMFLALIKDGEQGSPTRNIVALGE